MDSTDPPKIAVAVREDLPVWQKLNVVAFLTSGIGTSDAELIGEPYVDGDERTHLCMLAHPVIVLSGDAAALARGLRRATERGLATAIYVEEMFATGNDADNRATVREVPTAELPLVGLAVVGSRREVDRSLDRLRPHR
ncbi:DUF2000 domain-containing protein [Euzebya tangerina]|uniref:DUF2000 domain-containing protein n=1 Tax=Euzebya tangerina TaxID=591198 RepID=UPI000E31C772|nr:DUF2000 domain-containing protein [Euzebya tangerina]